MSEISFLLFWGDCPNHTRNVSRGGALLEKPPLDVHLVRGDLHLRHNISLVCTSGESLALFPYSSLSQSRNILNDSLRV